MSKCSVVEPAVNCVIILTSNALVTSSNAFVNSSDDNH